MNIGINLGSHALHYGGGFKAAWWHVKAVRDLGHAVTIFTSSAIHPRLLPSFHGIPIRWYKAGVEQGFEGFITINHFDIALPLATHFNIQHVMFPVLQTAIPDELTLTANSAFTASHIKDRWNRDAQVLYIPIENDYRVGTKENLILHVSRFAEPNEWADKAHRQLIQSMRLIRNDITGWRLVLAGAVENGQNGYVNSLMEMASGYPVDFLFDPNDDEIRDLYSRASIYWHATGVSLPLVPSAQEHLGLAPLEASASGAVPIVYRSGGMPEVVRDRVTGLLFDDIREMGRLTTEIIHKLSSWAAFQQYGLMWTRGWQDYAAFVDRVSDMIDGRPIRALPNNMQRPQFKPQEVTCVIPTYNNATVLARCLETIKETAPDLPVLILNNGAPLDSVPDGVKIHNNPTNLGFGDAYRLAESMVTTPLVLMLNDDIEATFANWLEMLLVPLNDPSVGIVGPKLLFPDGSLQHAGGLIDWRRDDIGYHRYYGQADTPDANMTLEPDFVTGAALLCRRELFHLPEELAGLYNYEDVWMCLEAKRRGFRIVYQPASALIHAEGATKARNPDMQAKVDQAKALFKARWQT